jgi:5S rRNA maturation endonuclease (ribonuclease M5)
MKQAILNYFNGDFLSFYEKYLTEIKRSGKEFKALCPFHPDKNPSLNINPETGLFKCHPCGAGGDIFKFYALKHNINGNFPAVMTGIAADFGISENGAKSKTKKAEFWSDWQKHITKAYDYTDASGALLFQVCRVEPHPNGNEKKPFRQRRPDGKGGWICNIQGVERVLYRLPELAGADEVFIVEGEKDADTLAALGCTATTNVTGAGKWKPEYSEVLAGKRCLIIPDADEVGRKHANDVARSLTGKAAAVFTIELPIGKKDVSEYLAGFPDPVLAGERLSMLVDDATEYRPSPEQESTPEPEGAKDEKTETPAKFKFIHNADILKNLRPIEWRIRDVLVEKSFYYNFGDSGHYKTFVELDRCLCIASGIDYHGHKVKQGPVFYIAGEGQQGIGRRIAAWHAIHGTKAADVPFFIS